MRFRASARSLFAFLVLPFRNRVFHARARVSGASIDPALGRLVVMTYAPALSQDRERKYARARKPETVDSVTFDRVPQ